MSPRDAAARASPATEPASEGRRARTPQVGADEKALVERARNGDRAAMRQLIEKNQRRMYQLAITIVKDHEEAMDVVQEALIKVHQNLQGFKGDAQFSTWAYRITYNLAVDALRRSGGKERVDVEDTTITDEGTQYEPWSTGESNPAKRNLRGELGAEIQRALSTLSEAHRTIIVLREVEELSYEEISATLRIPKGTVMSRLFHARQKLQAALKGYLADADAGGEGAE